MTQLKRRMVTADLFSADDLGSCVRRTLYVGLMSLAEDSGCLPWNPAQIRALVLPYEDVTTAEVSGHMAALVESGRVWTYTANGREYAYVVDFPAWQARSVRWSAPEMIPLPPWITFKPFDADQRRGSGRYTWPASREDANAIAATALDGTALHSTEEEELDLTVLDSKGAATSQRTASAQPAFHELRQVDDAWLFTLEDLELPVADQEMARKLEDLACRLSAVSARRAVRFARKQALTRGTEKQADFLLFALEAEIERE